MTRLFRLTAKFPEEGAEQEEAILILPDTWNADAILDMLAGMDLENEEMF